MFCIYQSVTLGKLEVIYLSQTHKKGTSMLISCWLITQEEIFWKILRY